MNIIKQYFSQEARDKRTLRTDQKNLAALYRIAENTINVRYCNSGIWITIDNTPTFRVTNDSDLNARTIAIGQVELFIKELRDEWVNGHKDYMERRLR